MSDKPKVFGLLIDQVEFLTFTVAHAVASSGWRVVILADPARNTSTQNSYYTQRLSALPGVSVETGFTSIDFDFLCVELTRLTPRDRADFYARRATRVGIVTYCARETWLRTILAELMDARRCRRCVLRARRFVYVDGWRNIDLFGLLGTRKHLGIDVHSSFLLDARLREMMFAHDWEPSHSRPYRLNFIGTPSPDSRARILQDLEAALSRRGERVARVPEQSGDILWLNGVAVSGDRFCRFLTDSDYTLCPPGHIRLTHRVIEALLRGSIPILHADELPLYDLNLESGINCIAVSPAKWDETVAAAINADLKTKIRMRTAILQMREKYLTIAASNRRICRSLGISRGIRATLAAHAARPYSRPPP